MESAGEVKVYSDLVQNQAQQKQLLSNSWMAMQENRTGSSFMHLIVMLQPVAPAAFERLNFSELTALDGAVQNGMADSSDEKVRIQISSQETSVLSSISLFFGAITERGSTVTAVNAPTSGIRIMGGDAKSSFWGPDRIWSWTTDFCVILRFTSPWTMTIRMVIGRWTRRGLTTVQLIQMQTMKRLRRL